MEGLIKILKKYNHEYIKIDNENSLKKICQLFLNNAKEEPKNSIEYFYYGVFHNLIYIDYELMKKYYLMAIEQNESYAMNNLGFYYSEIEKYDLAKKYYLMAIEQNNSSAIVNLGVYYSEIEKNYDLSKKYYLMAIEQNSSTAMNNLGVYYKIFEENYDLAKKYYLMAVEQNSTKAMNNLGIYYEFIEENYNLAKKYYLMSIEQNDSDGIINIKKYYSKHNDYSFVELYKYQDEFIDLMNDKFKGNIDLPEKYHYSFCQWNSENLDEKVKMKQYILKKTGVFPKNYNEKYLIHFMEIISTKKNKLTKDIMNLIAGRLFR